MLHCDLVWAVSIKHSILIAPEHEMSPIKVVASRAGGSSQNKGGNV